MTRAELLIRFPKASPGFIAANCTEAKAPAKAPRRSLAQIMVADQVEKLREAGKVPAAPPLDTFSKFVPIHIRSESNSREHWRVKAKHVKEQRAAVTIYLADLVGNPMPQIIHLVRFGKRLLDGDNLQGGFKAARDSIAALLQFDDRDPRVLWKYDQQRVTDGALGFSVVVDWNALPKYCPHCRRPY